MFEFLGAVLFFPFAFLLNLVNPAPAIVPTQNLTSPPPIVQEQRVQEISKVPEVSEIPEISDIPDVPEIQDYIIYARFLKQIQKKDTPLIERHFQLLKEQKTSTFLTRKANMDLADYYMDQKAYDSAKPLYETLINLGEADPFGIEAKFKLIKLKDLFPHLTFPDVFLDSFEERFSYAKILYERKKYPEAEKQLTQLTELFPNHTQMPDVLLLLGMTYFSSYNFDKAIVSFSNLIQTYPYSRLLAQSYFYMARSHARKKQFVRAVEIYKYILAHYPQNGTYTPLSYYYLYETFLVLEKKADFRPYLRRFKRQYPHSFYLHKIIFEQAMAAYQKKDYDQVLAILNQISFDGKEYSELKARLLFLNAKCEAQLNHPQKAKKLQDICLRDYPFLYSSFRFLDIQVGKPLPDVQAIRDKIPSKEIVIPSKYMLLAHAGLAWVGASELEYLIATSPDADKANYRFYLAYLYQKVGRYYQSVNLLTRYFSFSTSKQIGQMMYPLPYWDSVQKYAKEFNMDPYLIMALIRGESMYHDTISSRSGAIGLMQIMPATGQGIASHLGVAWTGEQMLLDADTNIRFGTFYLANLAKRFDGNIYLMLSGYNGGPNATKRWVEKFGIEDMDQFVFSIPYSETQYYIQKVLQNYWMYRLLY